MLALQQINIYPLKSARGISLPQANVAKWGLEDDRIFMLVDKEGNFLSQRQFPLMATIEVKKSAQGQFVFSHAQKDALCVEPLSFNGQMPVKIWKDQLQANTFPAAINNWFRDILATECFLVAMPEQQNRQVDLDYAQKGDQTAFSDGFPLLLISQASLDELNQRLKSPIPMNRFRPNLVIAGGNAFQEDNWEKIRIGEVIFDVVKPCSRCIIPTTDQKTGKRQGAEPLQTLATYRKKDGKIYFGQNLIQRNLGIIKLQDTVTVLASRNQQ